MSNSNNNGNNGIFINKISENQPELQQPVIKRQRIDGNNEPPAASTAPSQAVPRSSAFLDDSGNSTSSSSSPPSPVNESENIADSEENEPTDRDDVQLLPSLLPSDKECLSNFQTQLTHHQCLCELNERTLKIPFQYYSVKKVASVRNRNENSEAQVHYINSLKHWPEDFLLKFLSNLQLLFHVYLKQNAKGNVCGKIMDLCDQLTRDDHFFEELIELCNTRTNSSNFVSYVSSKIITYFLIIIKEDIDHNWINKVVDNLFTYERLDYFAVKKINFNLDIIKCIIEWKDNDENVLEEDSDNYHQFQAPPLETNYFALSHHYQSGPSTSSSSSALPWFLTSQASDNSGRSSATSGHNSPVSNGCHIVPLTDSESFDTQNIKELTTEILSRKWSTLVEIIQSLIKEQLPLITNRSSPSFKNIENCILTFVALWESIINVKTGIPVKLTIPFTKHYVEFEKLLSTNLPCTIYKQMLQLFNEVLCYASTIALQDLEPQDQEDRELQELDGNIRKLANNIFSKVKASRFLESMPRQVYSPNDSDYTLNSFVGPNCQNVIFSTLSFHSQVTTAPVRNDRLVTFDKSLVQKLTLLVLKSVAVSVKEIKGDSSDSSAESVESSIESSENSSDAQAIQEMTMIERSIRDALTNLESFIKNTLEFHPESKFSKILIRLLDDQDDYMIEAMVCALDVISCISYRGKPFPELVSVLNPVFIFLEFLEACSKSSEVLLDLLVSNETSFLLYLLRFLKYVKSNWSMFEDSCKRWEEMGNGNSVLENTMQVMTGLRKRIERLDIMKCFPYHIKPILRLLNFCENLYNPELQPIL